MASYFATGGHDVRVATPVNRRGFLSRKDLTGEERDVGAGAGFS